MTKESEPRPITVSELIARGEGDAFPRSGAPVRRSRRISDRTPHDGKPVNTASGMPDYHVPVTPPGHRTVGASGMPGFTPPGDAATRVRERNVVTGVIPVVSDEPEELDLPPVVAVEARVDAAGAADVTEVVARPAAKGAEGGADDERDSDLFAEEHLATAAELSGAVPAESAPAITEPAALTESAEPDGSTERVAVTETAGVTETVALTKAAVPGDAVLVAETATAAAAGDEAARPDAPAGRDARKAEKARAAAEKRQAKQARKAAKARPDAAAAEVSGEQSRPSTLGVWLGLFAELAGGLIVGAGMFWGFTEIWRWNVYFALVLAVVVIFAVVSLAHVLRRRDLPTTLLALAAGMIVTLGPLVFLFLSD